jgi:hypothetical protein
MTGMRWGAWLNVFAGMVLASAPFAFEYHTLSEVAMYEAVIVGLLITGVALWSALSTDAPAYLDYALAVLGVWSVAAPYVLGYHTIVEDARNADIVMGIAVAAIALISHFYVSSSPVERPKVTA